MRILGGAVIPLLLATFVNEAYTQWIPQSCASDDFRCGNGQCIPSNKVCDRVKDCPNLEDESNCECAEDEFRCETSGFCIEGRKRCDLIQNCDDGSDETDCSSTCSPGQYRCPKSSSILCATKCDGQPECDGGEDENDCYDEDCALKCDDRCIPGDMICDHKQDCSDGSDELYCENCNGPDDFRCESKECLSYNTRCNGIRECEDGSDEDNCNGTLTSTTSCENQFRCQNGICVDFQFYCDGNIDCSDGSDESNCQCPENSCKCNDGTCLASSFCCNGIKECRDGSDEEDCLPSTTSSPIWPAVQPPITTTEGFIRPINRYPGYDQTTARYPPYDQTPDPYGQRGGNRYPDPYGQQGGNTTPDPYAQQGGGYPDDYGNRYPDQSGEQSGNRYPDQNGQDGSRYPDQSGEQSGNRYPDQNGQDGSRYPDQSGEQSGNRYPDQNGQDGSRYPDQNGQDGSRYPDQNGQDGSRYPDQSGQGGSRHPDQNGQDGSRYPDQNGQGGSRYPDENGQGGSRYPDQSGQDGSRYPDQSGQGGNRYPDPYGQQGGRYPPNSGSYGGSGGCPPNQWRCENGPCIDSSKKCDGHIDCPFDYSDEFDCPRNSPVALNLKLHPENQTVRHGGDVVFQCRDEGPQRAAVRWIRAGGIPLKQGSTNERGRLEMIGVTESDSGVYICQASDYNGQPGFEKRATLYVDRQPVTYRPPFIVCKSYEATCGNGQCIPKSSVCDGKVDCQDGADENSCHHQGLCEPNQFKCNNNRCVLKSWRCDAEDDCGDASDESDCGVSEPGKCTTTEFTCSKQFQCIPKSFQCDGSHDCIDQTDETCTNMYITQPPTPKDVRLNAGDTLTLSCKVVGIPVPYISWRLNWGHVPSQCVSTTENGEGLLVCHNMQAEHSGAYSCEAINNRVTTIATPDAIVFVNKTDPCPRGYFNKEARTPNECINCFCFGRSTECRSADLFTYTMPTPLGQGGTMLVGVIGTPTGDVQLDNQPISNQYHYQPSRNGATVTKLGDLPSWSDSHPYLTLPESYKGSQLKSYGGHIKYTIIPQTNVYQIDDDVPTIIIKSKYGNLFHISRASGTRNFNIEARFTPEHWRKAGPSGLVPASREDIMMTLNDIESILLRADLNNAGVSIVDFEMQSAEQPNVGLGIASLVEECSCPREYDGLSCQKCAPGYSRKKVGPWLGMCEAEQCPPGTFGDPSRGRPCNPCPCPLTNPENQFARTCSLGSDGQAICDCLPGYEGKHCEFCAENYQGNPLIPGDSCRPRPSVNCNPIGTKSIRPPDECVCKDNVIGRYCDQCQNNTFYLSQDSRQGCARCFCSGVTLQCRSGDLRRKTINVQFNVPQIVDQVKVYKASPRVEGSLHYATPTETELKPELYRGDVSLNEIDRSRTDVFYWSLPASFTGDKVTSYGGYLRYTLKNVPNVDLRLGNSAADVQIIGINSQYKYIGDFRVSDGTLNATVQLLEKDWQRPDGKEVEREYFLMTLADVKAILIKASYSTNEPLAIPVSASIDIAEPDGYGPTAHHVEQCTCPAGYIGTSCEDCAPGYARGSTGLYLRHCEPCECNGKSNMCNPETGACYNCRDNTEGENCESCKSGYELDQYGNCVPISSGSSTACPCDLRGIDGPCDGNYCRCKANVEGALCDRCRPGTFGLDSNHRDGCLSCYCSGVSKDCHEGSHYALWPLPAPVLGDEFGGFALTDLNAEQVIKDNFVPMFDQSELAYTFSVSPREELYWSLPVFPGNRVLSYGGSLSLRQKFSSSTNDISQPGTDVVLDGGDISIYWSNPNQLESGKYLSFQVPLKEENWYILNSVTPVTRIVFMSVLRNLKRVLVRATIAPNIYETTIADVSMDTANQIFEKGLQAAKDIEICMCPPGYSGTSCENCENGYYQDQSGYCRKCNCNGHNCQLGNRNQVVCNCQPPYTGPDCSSVGGDSSTEVTTQPPPPPGPTVIVNITSPTIKIQEVGSSVNFTCYAQSLYTRNHLPVKWSKSGGYLPQGRTEIDYNTGVLLITNLQITDSGKYICETSDGINTAQAIATLKVPGNEMTAPTVEIQPSVQDYYEGDRIELQCRASGNPSPTIRWQAASNRPLPPTAQFYENLLIIDSARTEDTGEYRCVASNYVGSVDRTAMITIRPRPAWPQRETLIISNPSPVVNEGESIRIVCTGTTNVPAGSINWVRQDNSLFSTNVRSENGILLINFATPEDQGVYVCQSPQSDVAPVAVQVTVISNSLVPEDPSNITVSVSRLRIPTGGSGTIDCTPVGRPLPLIKWTKHESSFGFGSSQRGNTLIINNAQDDDQGYYVCEGIVNKQSISRIYVYVEIETREQPRVEIWPTGEQSVPLGGTHEFICRVLGGSPEPDVTWSRNGGRPLSPQTEILKNNILRFNRIEVNDEGEYTCTASNVAGTVSSSSVIKVRSPPEIIITPSSSVQVDIGEPINVECRANGYPEPTVYIAGPDNRQLSPPSLGFAALRISSASEQDNGVYTCYASSAAGNYNEQFMVNVNRGDGGDSGFTYDEGSGDPEPPYDQNHNVYDEPKSVYAFEGGSVTLDCWIPGNRVSWSRSELQPLQRNAKQVGTQLIISDISRRDSGEYICSIYNPQGEVDQEVYTSLIVVLPPKITLLPKKQTVSPGDSPTVECVVEGDDIIDVTWRPFNRPSSRVDTRTQVLTFRRIEVEDAGKYECFVRSQHGNASAIAEVVVNGVRDPPSQRLISIERPSTSVFRVGDNVNVLCKANSRDVKAQWEKLGTNEYVDSVVYGDGTILKLRSVSYTDDGVYRCVGTNSYGQVSFEDFKLEIESGANQPPFGEWDKVAHYTAHLGKSVEMSCDHDLEEPVQYEWSREYKKLRPDVRSDQPYLRLESVIDEDAGMYVCRARNSRTTVSARAVLTITGIVPSFGGSSFISLPTLKDSYQKFEIEISFKPSDSNGLLLYNSENMGRNGDFIALHLQDGIPVFLIKTGISRTTALRGDRPLELNAWHTIRFNRVNYNKVTMDVDNLGPITMDLAEQWEVLDLNQNLYIGGVPDYDQLPVELAGTSGLIGCVSILILGRTEVNLMLESIERSRITECDTCASNSCLNEAVCQEARTERGYMCICASGYAGLNCDRDATEDACRPDLCGPGKCQDLETGGYRCSCPITHTGTNCEIKQSIEYPAFTGSTFLAIKPPAPSRSLKMSMKIKAASPVTDGIIMYCAENNKGYGGFTALTVHDGRLEFRYDLGQGTKPVVLVSNVSLSANDWTQVYIARIGTGVSMKINFIHTFEEYLSSPQNRLNLETPIFVGGVDESIILNNNTGVTRGFNGCIKDFILDGTPVDIVSATIQSANVKECAYERGDTPDETCHCLNGGTCTTDFDTCDCPPGYSGDLCQLNSPYRRPKPYFTQPPRNPCEVRPCQNNGSCRPAFNSRLNYTCDCPLGYAGDTCQMPLDLFQSVGFNGNGYLELPSSLLRYDDLSNDPAVIALAMHTTSDGVLLYHYENTRSNYGDYLLLRIERGFVILEWDLGGGPANVTVPVFVNNGDSHRIVAEIREDGSAHLAVENSKNSVEKKGLSTIMNADSNIYIGGIPEFLNIRRLPGFTGCIEQIEFMSSSRGLNLGAIAVTGRNAQRCREPRGGRY